MLLKTKTIHAVSCLDEKKGLPALPDNCVDHIITDPPYSKFVHTPGKRKGIRKGRIVDVDMGFEHLTDEERVAVAKHFIRVAKKWVLVFCDLEAIGLWVAALTAAGGERRSTALWVKTGATPKYQGDGPANGGEGIVAFWAGKPPSSWNAGGHLGQYLYPVDRGDRRHSCQKPQALMRQLVVDFTLPGELILDPYAGGGSTLIAAKSLDRDWVGFERDPEFVAPALAALRKTQIQTTFTQMLTTRTRKAEAYGLKTKKAVQLHLDDVEDEA